MGQLALPARRLAKEGRSESALRALVNASTTFVQEYLTLKGTTFQTNWLSGKLKGAAFPKASLTDKEHARMRKLMPYFLGHVSPNHYDGVWFEKAAAFLIEASYGPLIRAIAMVNRTLLPRLFLEMKPFMAGLG